MHEPEDIYCRVIPSISLIIQTIFFLVSFSIFHSIFFISRLRLIRNPHTITSIFITLKFQRKRPLQPRQICSSEPRSSRWPFSPSRLLQPMERSPSLLVTREAMELLWVSRVVSSQVQEPTRSLSQILPSSPVLLLMAVVRPLA
jgi:hypothetical protein